jgi:hypothetical protein
MTRLALALALTVGLAAPRAHAEPYAANSVLPKIELPDQHGAPRAIDETVRVVIFTRDMDAGKIVKEAGEKAGPGPLSTNGVVYVADLSGMPGVIRDLFAMPKLRDRPYPLLVDVEGEKTAGFPSAEGRPTVLVLDKLKVVSASNPNSVDELLAAIAPPAPASP